MDVDLHSFQPPLTPFWQQDPLFLAETSAVLATPFSCPPPLQTLCQGHMLGGPRGTRFPTQLTLSPELHIP